jgi:hypothetical protein
LTGRHQDQPANAGRNPGGDKGQGYAIVRPSSHETGAKRGGRAGLAPSTGTLRRVAPTRAVPDQVHGAFQVDAVHHALAIRALATCLPRSKQVVYTSSCRQIRVLHPK